jgi:general secretion pathway protein C
MNRPPTAGNRRRISQPVKDRVVEVSLQHPDYGARRLVPLLKREEILVSASSVYNILRGRGLQTRSLRLAKLAERQDALKPAPIRIPAGILKKAAVIPVSPRSSVQAKAYRKPAAKRPWYFHILNVLLLLAIGGLGDQLLQSGRQNGWEADAAAVATAPVRVAAQTEDVVRPPAEYRGIRERNSLGTSEPEPPAAARQIPPPKISAAGTGLGLKLIGTAVTDDPTMRIAVIDDRSNSAPKGYHEGDRVGGVRIKKIMRDKVIITTARGDALLAANSPGFGQGSHAASPGQETAAIKTQSVKNESLGSRPEAGASPFANIDALMAQLQISPYLENDQAAGIRLAGIGSRSPLTRLRLRNGDVITGVNGEKITAPAEATRFFEQLAAGDDITLQVIRRHRPKLIRLNFN